MDFTNSNELHIRSENVRQTCIYFHKKISEINIKENNFPRKVHQISFYSWASYILLRKLGTLKHIAGIIVNKQKNIFTFQTDRIILHQLQKHVSSISSAAIFPDFISLFVLCIHSCHKLNLYRLKVDVKLTHSVRVVNITVTVSALVCTGFI